MSYEAHKVINKDFEEMINDVCGGPNIKLPRRKGRPSPDFYDLPIYHEDFMKWWKQRDEEKHSMKITSKCVCGVTYTVYTEPEYVHDFQGQGTTSSTTYNQYQNVQRTGFFCWKCGKSFYVTGSRILKIKSNQLEVVL